MARTTIPIHPATSKSAAFEYLTTKKDELVGWARKFSLFPYPFVTACCAMEFMAVSSSPYDTDRFGAALPRFSPRQSDLLMVVGTVTHKQAPILLKVYEQMCEPKWVMAFGAARSSGRLLPELRGGRRHRQDHPGRHLRSGLSAAPRDGDRRHHAAAGQDRPLAASHRQPELLTVNAAVVDRLLEKVSPLATSATVAHGIAVFELAPAALLDIVRRLKSEFQFDLFLDVTAVDWLGQTPRFQVV